MRLTLPFVLFLAACEEDAGDTTGSSSGGTATSATDAAGPGSGAAGGATSTGSVTTTGAGAGTPGCGITETAGTTTETLDVGGKARTYVVSIPDSVSGMTPVPIIFGFHGFGGTGDAASQYFGLTGNEPALYVYPQALPLPDQNNGVGWDMKSDGVDVAFIDALIADLAAKHCVDLTRIFAAGHSHGASFSNHLGCYRPNVFKGIAPVAGGGPWAGACTAGGVAAMLTHGTGDDQVPVTAGEDSRDHWLEEAACAGAATMNVNPSPCVAYQGCSKTIRWCEHGGGHDWPDFAGDGIRQFFFSL
jgi:polyhydroxybutyrate depolymerase